MPHSIADPDRQIRAAAFAAIEKLSRQWNGHLPWKVIDAGFQATGERVHAAMQRHAPLIYFIGVAPAMYEPVFPVWVEQFRPEEGYVLLSTADSATTRGDLVAVAREGVDLAGLKGLDGARLRLPREREDWPKRAYLERRFMRFQEGFR